MPHRPLRIAIDLAGLAGPPDSEIAVLIEQTARLCADLGHHVEAVTVPIDRSSLREAVFTLWPYIGGELVDFFSALRPEIPIGDLLEPWTIGLAEKRQNITPEQLALCFSAIAAGQRAIATFYAGWDVVLSPVTRSAPLPVGAMAPTRAFPDLWQTLFDYVDYTPLHNLVGTPSVSLPMGTTAGGLPIGSLLSAAHGSDDLLLSLAGELEEAAPWSERWPPAILAMANAPSRRSA